VSFVDDEADVETLFRQQFRRDPGAAVERRIAAAAPPNCLTTQLRQLQRAGGDAHRCDNDAQLVQSISDRRYEWADYRRATFAWHDPRLGCRTTDRQRWPGHGRYYHRRPKRVVAVRPGEAQIVCPGTLWHARDIGGVRAGALMPRDVGMPCSLRPAAMARRHVFPAACRALTTLAVACMSRDRPIMSVGNEDRCASECDQNPHSKSRVPEQRVEHARPLLQQAMCALSSPGKCF
jgi:hypothetical protein